MPDPFHSVGLIGRPAVVRHKEVLQRLKKVLDQAGVQVHALSPIADCLQLPSVSGVAEIAKQCDLAVVIGGDGSLLDVAWLLARASLPVTGIHSGRLGFLADIPQQHLERDMTHILNGGGRLDQRLLLSAVVNAVGGSKQAVSDDSPRALNEVLLHSPQVAQLGEFEVFVDDSLLYRIRADGVIVATPTGSTAYSLSAGAPILAPGLAGLAIVPMLAHSSESGSVVLPADAVVRIRTLKQAQLTVDGRQVPQRLPPGAILQVQREVKNLCLLHPDGEDFFARVRDKLGWGMVNAGALRPAGDTDASQKK